MNSVSGYKTLAFSLILLLLCATPAIAGELTIGSGATLTLTSGTLDMNSYDINVESGGTFTQDGGVVTNTAEINVASGGSYNQNSGSISYADDPTASTQDATSIGETTATFHGQVNATGLETTVTFEYGLTTSYGASVAATPSTVDGDSDVSVSADVSGLLNGETYHYRTVATKGSKVVYGADVSFAIPSVPVMGAWGLALMGLLLIFSGVVLRRTL